MNTNRGKFKHGKVNATKNQLKKHVNQMADKDIKTIIQRIRTIPNLVLSRHVEEKIQWDGLMFQPAAIIAVLKHVGRKNIVEYNTKTTSKGKDARVLLRSNEVYLVNIRGEETECNLCFVLSLDTGEIITVYWNKATDIHKNMDWSRYTPHLQVV